MKSNPFRLLSRLVLVSFSFVFMGSASFAANNNSVTYEISRGGDGSAVVNWSIAGGLLYSGVGFTPANNNGNGFNGFIISANGIFNGSYFNNSLLPVTSTDGSTFTATGTGFSITNNVNSFVAIHSASSDSFGLAMSSAFPGSSDPSYTYTLQFTSGSGSFVLPISFDVFNVGSYTQFQPSIFDGGPYAGTMNTTVNVVPEPSALSLLALGLGGVIALRRVRRQAD